MIRTLPAALPATLVLASTVLLAGCNFDPLPVRAAGDVAVPLGKVTYHTVPAGDRDTVAELDNGKHRLVARLDGAGAAALEVVTASARHSVTAPRKAVRFDVAGAREGGRVPVTFVLKDAEWTLGPVVANTRNPPPNFTPNPNVQAKLYVKIVADEDTVADLSVPPAITQNEAVFQPAGGGPITAQATFAPPVPGAGDLSANLTVVSGGVYHVEIVARAEGQDIAATQGYVAAVEVKYRTLEVLKP